MGRYMTHDKTKWRKAYAKIASAAGENRYFIRVEYGKKEDIHGKMVMFYNEYNGYDKKEAKQALGAFIE